MLAIHVVIQTPELAEAIHSLAASLKPSVTLTDTPRAGNQTPAPQPDVTAPPAALPQTPPVTPPPSVPVAAPQAYTVEQITIAGAALVDAGKMNELVALLAKYGAQAVTQLQPEQLGAFATELRAIGAKI